MEAMQFEHGCNSVTVSLEPYGLNIVARGPRGGWYNQTIPTAELPELAARLMSELWSIDICRGCGREESECSREPCPDVLQDRGE